MSLLPLLCLGALPATTGTPSISEADSTPTPRHIPHVEISAPHTTEGEPCLTPLSTTIISTRDIESAHATSLLPLLAARVPSLFVTSRGIMGYGLSTGAAGTLKVRGIGGDKSAGVLVVMDGEPMVQGLMGHTLADTYQSLGAGQVEVVRGPASVRYGSDAMGGVINIKTQESSERRVQAHTAYGTYHTQSSGIHLNLPSAQGWSLMAAASHDRTDGHREGMDFEQYSALAKLGYQYGAHWRLMLQGYGTYYDSGNPGSTLEPLVDNRAEARRGLFSASVRHDYRRAEGSIRAYYSIGEHHIDDGYAPGETPPDYQFRSRDYIAGLTVDETIRPREGTIISLGGEIREHGGKAWNQSITTSAHHHAGAGHTASERSYIADTALRSAAGYIYFSHDLTKNITVDGGLRYERHQNLGHAWIPQGGVTLRPDRRTTLKALVSKGYRAPSLRELYMWQAANPELQAESVWNYEASIEQWWLNHRLRTQCTLYYLRASNLIETQYVEGRAHNENIGRQRNRGYELEADWQMGRHWHYTTHFSYLRIRQPITAAPRHKWHQELSLTTRHWRLAPALEYVGHLYTVTGSNYIVSYWLLNLNVECNLTRWLQLYARGENLTGARYEIIRGYPMPRATGMGGVKIRL